MTEAFRGGANPDYPEEWKELTVEQVDELKERAWCNACERNWLKDHGFMTIALIEAHTCGREGGG